ncbi:hypothetical protein SLS62_008575 [Diatrype stigma]|uniref:Cytochrome P450 n=1 Tax=Diatrype stigma TaxID=117547 RepID=A0AAN9UHG0_9PEZI
MPVDNHFFFGQAINLLRAETPTSLYIKWMREYPDAPFIRYLTVANNEVLVCNSLNCHKEVLQTQCYSFRKPDRWIRTFESLVGKGVMTMEGAEHRAARKMLAGPFSLGNIRKLEPVFRAKARDISAVFDHAIATNPEGSGQGVIDCTDTFSKATLDIVGATVLGIDLENITSANYGKRHGPGSQDAASGKRTEDYSFHQAYCVTFSQGPMGKALLYANGFFPTRWIPVEANRTFLFAAHWLNSTLTQIVRTRQNQVREAISTGKHIRSESQDLLTFLIEDSMTGGLAERLTEEEFVGDLMQFMSAGHDTSANVLSWGLYIMATKQDIQSRLRKEIGDMVAEVPDPTYAEIEKLQYLDHFVKEVLRMFSPATTLHRQATENLIIEGVAIPEGTTLDIVPSVTSLNPVVWGDDVDDIDPSRWDRLTGDQLSPYAFEAFSNGPRICIGRSFAYLEIKTIFVEIIRNHRFLNVEKPFTVENPAFTLRPAGLEVRLERIG